MAKGGSERRGDGDIAREALAVWQCLFRLTYLREKLEHDDMFLGSITLRPPSHEAGDWFLVVRMQMGMAKKVGFITGHDVAGCFRSLVSKLDNGSMNWKDDQYG